MNISIIGTPYPIYFIGESHCIAFGNTLFQTQRSGEMFLCKTRFLAAFRAEQYVDEQGRLHPRIIEALKSEGLINENGMPSHLIDSIHNSSVSYIAAASLMSPPIVLFGGDMSLHEGTLLPGFGNEYDFIIPDDNVYGFDQTKKLISLELVRKILNSILSPFLQGALILKNAGFNRLMIHCLPARTTDEKKAARFKVDYKVRSKITLLANRMIADFCVKEHIGYIDTWQGTTKDGFLLDEFGLDGIHLTKPATLISLANVTDYLLDHTASTHNPTRYLIALKRSAPPSIVNDVTRENLWKSQGVIMHELGAAFAESFKDITSFDSTQNTLARLDWVAIDQGGLQGIAMAMPTIEHIQRAEKFLAAGEAYDALHSAASGELMISSFRPVQIKKSITVSSHPAPAGTRKSILPIKGDGLLKFVSITGENIAEIKAKPGTMVVYDPNRVCCNYVPEGDSFDVIEMSAIPRIPGHPFRVIWAGFNDWPVDPFAYSTKEMLASPPIKQNYFLERAYEHPHS